MITPDMIRVALDVLGGCEKAAEMLGTNPRTVRRWYSGARPPGAGSLANIEMALRVRALELNGVADALRETAQ